MNLLNSVFYLCTMELMLLYIFRMYALVFSAPSVNIKRHIHKCILCVFIPRTPSVYGCVITASTTNTQTQTPIPITLQEDSSSPTAAGL
jgi:hypothetical protein